MTEISKDEIIEKLDEARIYMQDFFRWEMDVSSFLHDIWSELDGEEMTEAERMAVDINTSDWALFISATGMFNAFLSDIWMRSQDEKHFDWFG